MKSEEWIIAIRLRQLGDLLVTLEPLRALRAYADGRRVALVADAPFHVLLARYDFIDRLIAAPPSGAAAYARYVSALRALHPRAVIDFHGSARSALLAVLSGAPRRIGFDMRVRRLAYTIVEGRQGDQDGHPGPTTAIALGGALVRHVGAEPCDAAIPPMPVSDAEREQGRDSLAACGVAREQVNAGRVVGLNPGRAYSSKEWPAQRFARLARALAGDGLAVVVMWGPGEVDVARDVVSRAAHEAVRLAPQSSLVGLPGLLQNLSLLVTIDSGLKHLAVAARVPTVTLFGSTDPREWHMGTPKDAVMWKGYSCSPCRRAECPLGDTRCMDHAWSDVHAAAARALEM